MNIFGTCTLFSFFSWIISVTGSEAFVQTIHSHPSFVRTPSPSVAAAAFSSAAGGRSSAAVVLRGGATSTTAVTLKERAVTVLGKPLTKAVASSSLFVMTDIVIKLLFQRQGITFPSSLAGCCVLSLTLLSAPFHHGLYRLLAPGAKLMQKFMMIFLVPNLIVLPLCGGSYSVTEMAKIMTIIFGGFLFSLLSTCYSVMAVSKLFGTGSSSSSSSSTGEAAAASTKATTTETAAVSAHAGAAQPKTTAAAALPPKPFSDRLTYGSRTVGAVAGLAAIAASRIHYPGWVGLHYPGFYGSTLTTPLLTVSMLMATVHNFAFGARQSKKFSKVIHPLVSCTVLSWGWAYLLSLATGSTFTSMLRGYRVGGGLSLAASGAGDFLTFVLGPAVVSLGVSIYERRVLIRQNFKEVLTATGVSCVGGLFGTAFAVRVLRLASAELRLSMLPRNITSALAVAIAEILGANKSLAVAIAIVTGLLGANFGASLLDLFGIHDPVTRGLAIGSAAHGLGTAAFVDEKDAFPFAAISMALTAICGTLLVSVPAVKAAAIKLALGGLA